MCSECDGLTQADVDAAIASMRRFMDRQRRHNPSARPQFSAPPDQRAADR